VVKALAFRDHHWFTDGDLRRIERTAADAGVETIVTTEKDAARLDRRVAWPYLRMEVAIEPAQEFRAWLGERLRDARARRNTAA
jgi:tetraacyldisaccharide-1-P 4'-kinase